MPLYIKDDSVDALAIRYQKLSGADSKTAAVRQALLEGLASIESEVPLMEKIASVQAKADEIGPVDPEFDQKTFADDLWSDQ
ncbi:type II toxin-antitoxin system VapB family antitoxin [uncultured Roseobacter sp.]|uniref:type II toxin-antitoxin system VapB family antitoxin n=1 Tax=uncultured Roseobacter sp. TaxID=114847 RepID=UPI002612FC55|nr:type II toxin-antitoxin system VapB family antitoxin [uncultured Roseobacter sp.]